MNKIHQFQFIVENNQGKTVKDFLFEKGFSNALIRKIKREGKLFKNKQEIPLSAELELGDDLIVNIGNERLDVEGDNIPIDVIYEDLDILVVNKDPYIVVHPLRRYPRKTLANAVAYYLKEKKENTKIRFINRLDKNTSGLIIISKNLFAHEFVQRQIKNKQIKKVYWAIVQGRLKEKEGKIIAPIVRKNDSSIIRIVSDKGKEAITYFRVIEEYKNASLVELIPLTGRTHQLRVHMQYLNHPIIGDDLYNSKQVSFIKRQALHARRIEFILPRKRKKFILEAPLPSDIINLLTFLEKKNSLPNIG